MRPGRSAGHSTEDGFVSVESREEAVPSPARWEENRGERANPSDGSLPRACARWEAALRPGSKGAGEFNHQRRWREQRGRGRGEEGRGVAAVADSPPAVDRAVSLSRDGSHSSVPFQDPLQHPKRTSTFSASFTHSRGAAGELPSAVRALCWARRLLPRRTQEGRSVCR